MENQICSTHRKKWVLFLCSFNFEASRNAHLGVCTNGICCSWWDSKYRLQGKLPETPMQEHQIFCIGRLYIFWHRLEGRTAGCHPVILALKGWVNNSRRCKSSTLPNLYILMFHCPLRRCPYCEGRFTDKEFRYLRQGDKLNAYSLLLF